MRLLPILLCLLTGSTVFFAGCGRSDDDAAVIDTRPGSERVSSYLTTNYTMKPGTDGGVILIRKDDAAKTFSWGLNAWLTFPGVEHKDLTVKLRGAENNTLALTWRSLDPEKPAQADLTVTLADAAAK